LTDSYPKKSPTSLGLFSSREGIVVAKLPLVRLNMLFGH
jgi:hypothetical protein